MGNSALTDSIKYFFKKTITLVRTLCSLHNWLIDKNDIEDLLSPTVKDRLSIIARGGELINTENTYLNRSLGGGDHLDDVPCKERKRIQRVIFNTPDSHHPREYLLYKLQVLGIDERPSPMGSTTTNL